MEIKKDKQKLLYIVTQSEWGGAQKYIFDLATNLADEFEITVAAGPDGANHHLFKKLEIASLRSQNLKLHLFNHLKREINPYHDFLAILEISRFLKKEQFNIIHLNSSKAGVIGAIANSLNRIQIASLHLRNQAIPTLNNKQTKVIYTAHGWVYLEPQNAIKHLIYLYLERLSGQLRNTTIVSSNKEKEAALKYNTAKKETLHIIPNGIDLNKLIFLDKQTARKELKVDDNRFIIGTIANLYNTKGLGYLIEAIKILELDHNFNNCQVLIIGEGQERKNLEDKIKNCNLEDKIILEGTKQEASKYLKAFDIFILPSIKEGFPYTILEAMAAELPIIATRIGAIPEIIRENIEGLLVQPKNSVELTNAIKKLINNPDLRNLLAAAAQKRCNQYNLDSVLQKTKELYN